MVNMRNGYVIVASDGFLSDVAKRLQRRGEQDDLELADKILRGEYVLVMILPKKSAKKLVKSIRQSAEGNLQPGKTIICELKADQQLKGTRTVIMWSEGAEELALCDEQARLKFLVINNKQVLSRGATGGNWKAGDNSEFSN